MDIEGFHVVKLFSGHGENSFLVKLFLLFCVSQVLLSIQYEIFCFEILALSRSLSPNPLYVAETFYTLICPTSESRFH
jgi:hypothetical protein